MQLCHGCAIVVRVTYTDSTPCSQVLLGARTGALTATHDGNFSWGLGTSPIRTHSPDLTNAVVQDETSYTYKLCSVGPSEPAVLMPSHAELGSCWVAAGISFALNGTGAGHLQKLKASPVEFKCHSIVCYPLPDSETQDLSVGLEKRASSWSHLNQVSNVKQKVKMTTVLWHRASGCQVPDVPRSSRYLQRFSFHLDPTSHVNETLREKKP